MLRKYHEFLEKLIARNTASFFLEIPVSMFFFFSFYTDLSDNCLLAGLGKLLRNLVIWDPVFMQSDT